MKKQEINALAYRFKATSLMLINLNLLEIEEIELGIEATHSLFDSGNYTAAKKSLDLVDTIIVDILEQ